MSFQLVAVPCPGIAQLLAVAVPSVAQKAAVSGILVQWKRSFVEEVDNENASGSFTALLEYVHLDILYSRCIKLYLCNSSGVVLYMCLGLCLFSGLSYCSVNTSPQNFVVNVNPPPVP